MAKEIFVVILERWNDLCETGDFEHEDVLVYAFETRDDAVRAAFDCLKGGFHESYLPVAKDFVLFKEEMDRRSRVTYLKEEEEGISHDVAVKWLWLYS